MILGQGVLRFEVCRVASTSINRRSGRPQSPRKTTVLLRNSQREYIVVRMKDLNAPRNSP